jgi:uncharacterized membrane protein YfcA
MELTPFVVAGIVAFGVAVGALSAFLGVGGGLVMVPFMVLVLGLGQQSAEGTSLLVILPTAAAGVIAHSRRGFVSFRAAAWLSVGGTVGSFAGALIALNLSGARLQTLFGIFVCIMGVRLVALGVSRRPG